MTIRAIRTALAKRSVIVAAGLGAAAVLAVPAGAASAACTYDHACLYSNANYGGYKYDTYNSTPNLGNVKYAGTQIPLYAGDHVPSNVSSLENWDPDSTIAVYYNSGYRGPCFTVSADGWVQNFATVTLSNGLSANDDMNSFHFNRVC